MPIPSLDIEYKKIQSADATQYTFEAKVVANTNIAKEIFVLQYSFVNETSSYYSLATPTQLLELPKNNPEEGNVFYLTDRISILFSDGSLMLEFEESLKRDIQKLIDDYNELQDSLNTTYVITYTPSEDE